MFIQGPIIALILLLGYFFSNTSLDMFGFKKNGDNSFLISENLLNVLEYFVIV